MINPHVLLVFSIITLYELAKFVRLKSIIFSNVLIYKKIIKLLQLKNVSDLKKERVILVYSKLLLISSIKILLILIFVFSFLGFLEMSTVFIVYNFFREKYA